MDDSRLSNLKKLSVMYIHLIIVNPGITSFLFVLFFHLFLFCVKVLEGMVERRDSPDGETWLLLLNAVDTAGALDKAVELMERSRAEGHGSEVKKRAGRQPDQLQVDKCFRVEGCGGHGLEVKERARRENEKKAERLPTNQTICSGI